MKILRTKYPLWAALKASVFDHAGPYSTQHCADATLRLRLCPQNLPTKKCCTILVLSSNSIVKIVPATQSHHRDDSYPRRHLHFWVLTTSSLQENQQGVDQFSCSCSIFRGTFDPFLIICFIRSRPSWRHAFSWWIWRRLSRHASSKVWWSVVYTLV